MNQKCIPGGKLAPQTKDPVFVKMLQSYLSLPHDQVILAMLFVEVCTLYCLHVVRMIKSIFFTYLWFLFVFHFLQNVIAHPSPIPQCVSFSTRPTSCLLPREPTLVSERNTMEFFFQIQHFRLPSRLTVMLFWLKCLMSRFVKYQNSFQVTSCCRVL